MRESCHRETERVYNEHAHALEELHIGSQVAVQKPTIKAVGHLWHHHCCGTIQTLFCQNTKWMSACLQQAIHQKEMPPLHSST